MFYRSKTGNRSAEDVQCSGEVGTSSALIADVEKGNVKSVNNAYGNAARAIGSLIDQNRKLFSVPRRGHPTLRVAWCKILLLSLCTLCSIVFLLSSYTMIFLRPRDPCMVAEEAWREAQSGLQHSERRGANGNVSWTPLVPKIIHQQWKVADEIPEKYADWHAKWKELYPDPEYKHILWSDESARDLIVSHYSWFLDVYDGYEFNIQRADASRYFILHHYGGIYADLDYEPLKNFWDFIPKDRVGIIESPYRYNEYVQNSLMSSPQRDPFWFDVFRVLQKKASAGVLKSTGPVLMDSAMAETKQQWAYLPCELFHRIPLGETDKSPFATLLHREILGRLYPMRSCGSYSNPTCQFGKHHNTATYLGDTGILKLIF